MHRLSLTILLTLFMSVGCVSRQPTPIPQYLLTQGRFHIARDRIQQRQVNNPANRAYLLDRARVGILTLADGYPESALTVFETVYEVLRTQGLNEGKQFVAVAINEDLKIWKGEPFEQAITLAYISMAHASVGSWDNARAAAGNALFFLRDFGNDEQGRSMSTLQLATASAQHDANPQRGVDLESGYVVEDSDFALGYYLHGLASQQLGRSDEANAFFGRVQKLRPYLANDLSTVREGEYDTVLVVSWGVGPRKIGTGPDNAIAAFRPRTLTTQQSLSAAIDNQPATLHPLVTDLNVMAADHRWNNLEDIRIAKSYVGQALLFGGLVVADAALYRRNGEAAAIAGGLAIIGAILRAGAHADTRFNDILPQRFYVVPLNLGPGLHTVELKLPGHGSSRMKLHGLEGRSDPQSPPTLRYVRLIGSPYDAQPPAWATTDGIRYGNPHTGPADTSPKPFLLGGMDVQLPTDATLSQYETAGTVDGLSLMEFQNFYRDRGITWTIQDTQGIAGPHLLEGGKSLVAPLPGTTGFTRLFSGQHPPYPDPPKDPIGSR
jgi:tetratricopeptide (TPR) repeat protein